MGIKVTKINRVIRCKQNDYIWKEYRKSNAKKGTEAITLIFRKTWIIYSLVDSVWI